MNVAVEVSMKVMSVTINSEVLSSSFSKVIVSPTLGKNAQAISSSTMSDPE